MEVVVRGGTPDDVNFVLSTWLRGLYHGSTHCSEVDKNYFFTAKAQSIHRLLLNPSISLRIATLPGTEASDLIVGYAVLEWTDTKPELHWVYVKEAFRKQGVATELLKDTKIDTVTNITDLGNDIRKKKKLRYKPRGV